MGSGREIAIESCAIDFSLALNGPFLLTSVGIVRNYSFGFSYIESSASSRLVMSVVIFRFDGLLFEAGVNEPFSEEVSSLSLLYS